MLIPAYELVPNDRYTDHQYAVFWSADAANASVRHAHVSRRILQPVGMWETFVLPDYNQTDDDGHDMSA